MVSLKTHARPTSPPCIRTREIATAATTGASHSSVTAVCQHLPKHADRIHPEAQCGFHGGSSTIGMIFSLCQFQGKFREQQAPLYIAFVDFTNAFNSDSRLASTRHRRRLDVQGCILGPTLSGIFLSALLSFDSQQTWKECIFTWEVLGSSSI